MTQHLLALELGPVVQIIAAARKTRDLYFGSWMLSEIAKAAARQAAEMCGEAGRQHEALLVPAQAIATEGQVQKVFVVSDGRARARMVTTGAHHEGRVEVLSGLVDGETIVNPAPAGLLDGSKVEVRR